MQVSDIFVDELSFKGNPATRLYIGFVDENNVCLNPVDKDEIAEVGFFDIEKAKTILIDKRIKVLNDAFNLLKNSKV